ncbi:MAG: heme-binding protein [Candidatus Eisenbacteria bacterium]|nr:heme-binding protein [Candidatus Eisenbacteria bacterium]
MSKTALIFVLALLFAIQLVPVDRSNPPVVADLEAGAALDAVLRESCYDCHSHETDWPWYAYAAPVSWLVANDVEQGREHMNFSLWGELSEPQRRHLAQEMWEEVERRKMPPQIYLFGHSEAKLTAQDREILQDWVREYAGGLPEVESEASRGFEAEEEPDSGHDH